MRTLSLQKPFIGHGSSTKAPSSVVRATPKRFSPNFFKNEGKAQEEVTPSSLSMSPEEMSLSILAESEADFLTSLGSNFSDKSLQEEVLIGSYHHVNTIPTAPGSNPPLPEDLSGLDAAAAAAIAYASHASLPPLSSNGKVYAKDVLNGVALSDNGAGAGPGVGHGGAAATAAAAGAGGVGGSGAGVAMPDSRLHHLIRLLEQLKDQQVALTTQIENLQGILTAAGNLVRDDTTLRPSSFPPSTPPPMGPDGRPLPRALTPEGVEALRLVLKQGRKVTEQIQASISRPAPLPSPASFPPSFHGSRGDHPDTEYGFESVEAENEAAKLLQQIGSVLSTGDGPGSVDVGGPASPSPSPSSSRSNPSPSPPSPPPPLEQLEEVQTDCTVAFPGVVCSTTTSIQTDPPAGAVGGAGVADRKAVVVTRTVCRLSPGPAPLSGKLTTAEMVALAAQALVPSATRFAEAADQRARAVAGGAGPDMHKAVLKILQEGKITKVKQRNVSEYGHLSFVVEVQDRHSARTIEALFKPRDPNTNDFDGWHRTPIEFVAYELNRLLGLDLVPPAAHLRGGVEVEGERFEEGTLVYYAQNAHPLDRYPRNQLGGVDFHQLLSDTRILDVLLQNSDRHLGHFLMGEHWALGRWGGPGGRWKGDVRPVLIDHAAGFRRGAWVSMDHENAFQTGPVRTASAATYLRLRLLDRASLAQLRGALSEEEIGEVINRRDTIIRYLDKVSEEQGVGQTLIDYSRGAAPHRAGSGAAV